MQDSFQALTKSKEKNDSVKLTQHYNTITYLYQQQKNAWSISLNIFR